MFEKILELCKQNCLGRDKYIEVLEQMELPEPSVSSHIVGLMDGLKKVNDLESSLLDNYSDNPYVRMSFGEIYLYWNLWHRIKNSGVGHLMEFHMEHSAFKIVIFISPSLSKDDNETSEEYKARKEQFFETFPYKTIDTTFGKQLADTQENRDKLKDWLECFIDFYSWSIEAQNGFIRKITMFSKSVLLCEEEKQKERKFDKAAIERIERICKDAKESQEISKCIGRGTDDIITSDYCAICKELSYENEYCKRYQMLLPQVKNIKDAKKEFGKTIPQEELLSTYKELSKKVEDMFAKTAKFSLLDYCWHDGAFRFRGNFSSNITMFYKKEFFDSRLKFDDIAEDNGMEYLIGAEYIAVVREVFEKEYHCSHISMEIEDRDGRMVIKSVSGMIMNPMYLPL